MLHNSNSTKWLYGEDRKVKYGDGVRVLQREKKDASKMTFADTKSFIADIPGDPGDDRVEGTVDIKGNCSWLNSNNYFSEKNSQWEHPCLN